MKKKLLKLLETYINNMRNYSGITFFLFQHIG